MAGFEPQGAALQDGPALEDPEIGSQRLGRSIEIKLAGKSGETWEGD